MCLGIASSMGLHLSVFLFKAFHFEFDTCVKNECDRAFQVHLPVVQI